MPSSITEPLFSNRPTTLRALALDGIRMTGLGRILDGAPLPETFEPSPHHRDELAKARARLAAIEAQTPAEAEAAMLKEQRMVEAISKDAEAHRVAAKARYDAMLARLDGWEVPANVADYRALIIRHLADMRDADCRPSIPTPEPMGLDVWRANAIKNARWAVDYHEKQWAEEQKRCAEKNAFVQALRASLPPEGDPSDTPIGGEASQHEGAMDLDIEQLRQEAIQAVIAAGCTGWPTDPGFVSPTSKAMGMYAGWLAEYERRATDPAERVRFVAARVACEKLGKAVCR